MFGYHHHGTISTVAFTVLLNACGASALSFPAEQSNLGGDGLPVQIENQPIPHQPRPTAGVLRLRSNGCWAAELEEGELLVIFPVGFHKPAEDGSVMRSPEGESFIDGTSFEALGAVVPVESLPGASDGFFGEYLAFCDSDARHVVVLDSLQSAGDATDGAATG